jgi:predicted Na+-dependent transporter
MQQILLVVTAIVLGLGTGALTGGFAFSSAVCLVAGIFLVTPSLFKFQLSDLGLVTRQGGAIWRNLWINYGLLVGAALLIGYFSRDIGIAGALLLLALLPGGGMVMMWIRTSGANVKLGFIVFMLNLALLLPVTLVFGAYHDLAAGWFPAPDLSAAGQGSGRTVMPFAPFMILIVIPFVLSRIVRSFAPALVALTEKHQQLISKATMFGIVFYLFSLSTSQLLFKVNPADLGVALVATLAFYAVAFLAARYLTPETPEGRAVYWHVATRYITLALILAVFSIDTYGATFILPVMIAYFIQIGAAGQLRTWMLARGAQPARATA